MRLGPAFGGLKRFIDRIEHKWTDFWSEVIRSIAEEEMRIQRDEFVEQAGTREEQWVRK